MAFTEGCRKKNRKKSVKKRFTRRKKSQFTVKKRKNFFTVNYILQDFNLL